MMPPKEETQMPFFMRQAFFDDFAFLLGDMAILGGLAPKIGQTLTDEQIVELIRQAPALLCNPITEESLPVPEGFTDTAKYTPELEQCMIELQEAAAALHRKLSMPEPDIILEPKE